VSKKAPFEAYFEGVSPALVIDERLDQVDRKVD